jgi:general stress protein 26
MTESKDMKVDLTKEMVSEAMKKVDFCMMTTLGSSQAMHTRPMSNNRKVEWDGDTWFFSAADSSQVQEIKADPHVNLGYSEPKEMIFIALSGNGEVISDVDKKKELWSDELAMWFPDGPESDGLVLIKVRSNLAHYWSKEGEGELTL